MQREIASVMAACGMRNIRYVAFPPVVFETPGPAITPEPSSAPETDPLPQAAEALPPPAPAEAAPPPPEPVAALPHPLVAVATEALPEPSASAAPVLPATPLPGAPRPGMRRLAELAAEVAEVERPRRGTQPRVPPHASPLPVVTEGEAPAGLTPLRNYALLQDIAGELRPRRVRARGGKRA